MTRFVQEFKATVRSPLPYVIWAALTVVLTLGGPFGTYDALPVSTRNLYWAGVVALSIAIGRTVRILVDPLAGRLPPVLALPALAAAIALALAPVLWLYSDLMLKESGPSLPALLTYVFPVAVAVLLIRQGIAWAQHGAGPAPSPVTAPAPSAPAPTVSPQLLRRIDPALRGRVLRLSARNHHLEVQTDRGQVDLLLRLSDGMAEVEAIDGAQVHRSHWVAWEAVAGAERCGSRLFLVMTDGTRVPVSRPNEPLLVARGLIGPVR